MAPATTDLWRISNHPDLTGEGGLRYPARWHHAGRRIVYLAESPAGALIEVLVHLELEVGLLPPAYTLLRVSVPEDLKPYPMPVPSGEGWQADIDLTRRLGTQWLRSHESALARVPSVILPATYNVLLNPVHPDAQRLQILKTSRAVFDPRLLCRLRT